jgi:ABC-type nickel/cobalt efflux system permease component RcnA
VVFRELKYIFCCPERMNLPNAIMLHVSEFHFTFLIMKGPDTFNRISIMLGILFLLLSCNSKKSERRQDHEAIALHNSMIKKANEIQHRLNVLEGDSTINRDSIFILSGMLEQWKRELVEVPGNEDHGDHAHHDHDHEHVHGDKTSELTEEQMLEIQKELDRRLSAIGVRIMNLRPEPKHTEHQH